jgi:hypothetical protein
LPFFKINTKLSPNSQQHRYYRNRRDLYESGDLNQPDPSAYINAHHHQTIKAPANAATGQLAPQSTTVTQFAERQYQQQQGTFPKMTFRQKMKMKYPLTFPTKLEDDIPMMLVKEDGKSKPQLYLPRSNHQWYQLWKLPKVIIMARAELFLPFVVYSLLSLMYIVLKGIPTTLHLSKDAQEKRNAILKELHTEESYLTFMQSKMTIDEIGQAFGGLPRKPGVDWNPDEEEEMERLTKRLFYPQ